MRLLPVLDALDLAIAHVKSQAEPSDSDKALEQIDTLLPRRPGPRGHREDRYRGRGLRPDDPRRCRHAPDRACAGCGAGTRSQRRGRAARSARADASVVGDKAQGQSESPRPSKAAKTATGHDGPTVVQVMRAGYKMRSKVLRPAMVFVGG